MHYWAAKPQKGARKSGEAAAPISSRFLCPHLPILLSAPNQNRHVTRAISIIIKNQEPNSPIMALVKTKSLDNAILEL